MEKEPLQKTVNCQPIQSENIEEIQRSLLELHTERRAIALKAIEATVNKYYAELFAACQEEQEPAI